MENFHLPEEIILNILLRLPIICFIRFRCVCKAWYSLLSDPIFMYKNLTFTDSDDDHHLQLLIKLRQKISSHNYFSLISFHNLEYNSKRYLPFVKGISYNAGITVVGCCNGFVCLTNHSSKIFLWNPLTKQTKLLPKSPHYLAHTDIPFDEAFNLPFEVGFLFDSNANDYKVIKIYHMREVTTIPTNVVYLYSFRSDSWRKLDFSLRFSDFFGIFDRIPLNSDQIFYHWIGDIFIPPTEEVDDIVPCVILSFDMNLELFQTTEIPFIRSMCKHSSFFIIGLFMLKDSVAIFATPRWSFYNGEAPIFEISVLLRIGVKESWTKLITIGPIADAMTMLGPWKNGSLFLRTRQGGVMVFNPFTKEIRILPSNGIHAFEIQIMPYKRGNVELGAINIG